MSYGEKIAKLRREKGITQATLGYHLNVTYQAVSKWERDESDPDFATMNKIAKYFGVPLSYFTDDAATAIASAAATSPAPVPATPQSGEQPVSADNTLPQSGAQPVSGVAAADSKAAVSKANVSAAGKSKTKNKAPMRRNVGLIVGGSVALAVLVTLIVVFSINNWHFLPAFILSALATLVAFTFVSQLFWLGVIIDIILWGFKIIGTPGIIFTFDLDGFIFLIGMKILFAVIKVIGLILLVFLATVFAIIASPFTFIPQLIEINKDEL